jgi:hypothetical protein
MNNDILNREMEKKKDSKVNGNHKKLMTYVEWK